MAGGGCDGSGSSHEAPQQWTVLLVAVVVVVISAFVASLLEALEHYVHQHRFAARVVEHCYEEIALLGLLGLLLQLYSVELGGPGDAHLLHQAHLNLFYIALTYVGVVGFMLVFSRWLWRDWRALELEYWRALEARRVLIPGDACATGDAHSALDGCPAFAREARAPKSSEGWPQQHLPQALHAPPPSAQERLRHTLAAMPLPQRLARLDLRVQLRRAAPAARRTADLRTCLSCAPVQAWPLFAWPQVPRPSRSLHARQQPPPRLQASP